MYIHYNAKFEKQVATIHPGEFAVSTDGRVIGTVLGSCVAVALYDRKKRFGGMNHFMLPGSVRADGYINTEGGKYGMFAMELLINEMIKNGSSRRDIAAKVFGGGHVLRGAEGQENRFSNVPQSNIDFAFSYLEMEGITVESSDVGGTAARKVYLFPDTFRVLLKRITGKLVTDVEREEEAYLRTIRRKPKETDVTLF